MKYTESDMAHVAKEYRTYKKNMQKIIDIKDEEIEALKRKLKQKDALIYELSEHNAKQTFTNKLLKSHLEQEEEPFKLRHPNFLRFIKKDRQVLDDTQDSIDLKPMYKNGHIQEPHETDKIPKMKFVRQNSESDLNSKVLESFRFL